MERLEAKKTAVIVVDVQDRLAQVMPAHQLGELSRSIQILLEGARILGAPVLLTEQYPKGLGSTLRDVQELADAASARKFEKTEFSAWDVSGFARALEELRVKSVVVVGMETHVCVYQSVRDLVRHGLDVYVPIDGVASRRDDHRATGLSLCERAGAIRTTSESVIFDWLGRAGTDEFKQLSKVIR